MLAKLKFWSRCLSGNRRNLKNVFLPESSQCRDSGEQNAPANLFWAGRRQFCFDLILKLFDLCRLKVGSGKHICQLTLIVIQYSYSAATIALGVMNFFWGVVFTVPEILLDDKLKFSLVEIVGAEARCKIVSIHGGIPSAKAVFYTSAREHLWFFHD